MKNVMIENNIFQSINQIYNLEVGKLIQKLALGIIPPPFINMFESQIRESSLVTRSASHYFQPVMSKQKCKQSIKYAGPIIWNGIPENMKKCVQVDFNCDLSDQLEQDDDSLHNTRNSLLLLKPFCKRMQSYAINNVEFI